MLSGRYGRNNTADSTFSPSLVHFRAVLIEVVELQSGSNERSHGYDHRSRPITIPQQLRVPTLTLSTNSSFLRTALFMV